MASYIWGASIDAPLARPDDAVDGRGAAGEADVRVS